MKAIISFLAFVLFLNGYAQAQPKVQDKVYTHKNLSIYLLEGKDMISSSYITLEEAMKQNKITLHETGSVNQLSADNKSGSYIFIMAGDIVKGGKQDRTIGEDVILKPGAKRVPLKSFCVEQSRWTKRGNEKVTEFSTSTQVLSDKKIKIAARSIKSQSAVWKEVNDFQENTSRNISKNVKSSVSATSLQLTLEDKDLKLSVKEYMDALKPTLETESSIVGLAFCINGKISTIEWFGNASLFNKLKVKLLESAANEAISNYDKNAKFSNPGSKSIGDFISAAKTKTFTSDKSDNQMIEKQYKTDKSIMFESFNTGISEAHPIHVSIYSTDGVSVSEVSVNQRPELNQSRTQINRSYINRY